MCLVLLHQLWSHSWNSLHFQVFPEILQGTSWRDLHKINWCELPYGSCSRDFRNLLGRLEVVLGLLCLSSTFGCTKVEFARVKLLKSYPFFLALLFQNLAYQRKWRKCMRLQVDHLCWDVSVAPLCGFGFHEMYACTWWNKLGTNRSVLVCPHFLQMFWKVFQQSNHLLLS